MRSRIANQCNRGVFQSGEIVKRAGGGGEEWLLCHLWEKGNEMEMRVETDEWHHKNRKTTRR